MTFAGKTHSLATKEKISATSRSRGVHADANNTQWKGDAAGYAAIHKWLYDRKERTGICELCGHEPIDKNGRISTDFANISGDYRRDVEDYIEVCRSCHRWWDS